LLEQLTEHFEQPFLLLNGEIEEIQRRLSRRNPSNYLDWFGQTRLILIDEAQNIPDVGKVLKLMVDEIPRIKILATGSSALSINKLTGEPLTGRKKTFNLFPLSEAELSQTENAVDRLGNLNIRLVLGNYPELLKIADRNEKIEYLQELVQSYLLRDILAFETIQNSRKVLDLLRLIAFQVGQEVSHHELSRKLGIHKDTVAKYLDLLTKVFIIYELGGFSRNLRKEVVKSRRYYFYDNGIRNVLINNHKQIELRTDQGALWENYIISERLKHQSYQRIFTYNYFWRTYDQQEIDWVEDREGMLHAYEMKWNPGKKAKVPVAWSKAYPESEFKVVNPDNYRGWLGI
ncbi:MAG: ATP-binding protein, partial [Bacteroidota bacterium]